MKRNKTFTMTDLFVLFAVLTIIFLIFMPTFWRGRHLGLRIRCASNLRGIGYATKMYVCDFHDKFPIVWTDEGDKEGSDEGHGNSNNHGTEGQNVLFADWSVQHFDTPTIGINGDNIYTRWDDSVSPVDKQIGKWGKGIFSVHKTDAYLGN
jgi:hypothetical protein